MTSSTQQANARKASRAASSAPPSSDGATSVDTTANQSSDADAYVDALAQSIETAPTIALFAREFEAAHPESPSLALVLALADDLRCLGDAQSAPSIMSPAVMERTLYRLAGRADALAERCRRQIGSQ